MNKFFGWIISHPVVVLVAVFVVSVGLGWYALSLEFSTDLQGMLPASDKTVLDYVASSKHYGSQDYLLVTVHDEQTVFNPRTLKKLWQLTRALQQLPARWVDNVQSLSNADTLVGTPTSLEVKPAVQKLPQSAQAVVAFRATVLGQRLLRRLLLSEDEKTALIIVEERSQIINSDEAIAMTEAAERAVEPFRGPEQIYLSGGPYIVAQVRLAMVSDLRTLIPFALGLLLLILLASFRQWRGMLLPVSVAFLSVVWTMGLMALLGFKLTIVSVAIPVILIAIGDADSIHLLTRYQEELHHAGGKRQALLRTFTCLTQPVIYTSLSSAVGFLGLATAYSVVIRRFGLATAVGILLAMLLSVTFLPALLAVLPARTSQHLATRRARGTARAPWTDVARCKRWVGLAIVALVLSASGISRIEINNNPVDYVRADSPVNRSTRFVEDTFGGSLTLRVSLDTGVADRWKDPKWLAKVQALQAYAEGLPYTGISTSLVDVVREINVALHDNDLSYDTLPSDAREVAQGLLLFEFGGGLDLDSLVTKDYSAGQVTLIVRSLPLKQLTPLLRALRTYLDAHFPNAPYRITGQPIFGLRLGQTLVRSQISSLLFSLVLVGLMMLALTRSWRLGSIALVPLVLSVAAMFGVMGFAGVNLDLGTVMVASVAIGIGVDFAIHFISQYTQARRHGPPQEAIRVAVALTRRALLYNMLSLGLGFSVMVFSQFKANIAFGALLALTVFVAYVASLYLVPALLLLSSKAQRESDV